MKLSVFDWTVIALYFLANLAIGLYYARRAKGSTSEFFLSGRDAPWWLAGTSMVATTFAADTPLVVTGLVVENGIAGNWLWWNFVMSGMLTVFFYARLWRRAGVMTDVEFAQLRYSGKPAAFLRGFRALYLGVPINCIILGWVNLAMLKILKATLDVETSTAVYILIGILAFTAFYTSLAGLWGVLVTDVLQFALKMTMVILLAVFAVNAVGGIDAMKSKIAELDAATGQAASRLDFLPPLESPWLPMIALLTYLSVTWWASWYPGAEPGGGGYVAQRIFSAKNERHGVLATLWFNVAHYALRPWPWILTALAALLLYPDLATRQDKESAYMEIFMNPSVFPASLRGFMIAGFAAAYMSTIATHLNWGASYVINDFYRAFVHRRGSERHYVIVSQLATVLIMIVALLVTFFLLQHEKKISDAWKLLLATGAGTGGVYLLRWYWWRINAWSEVAAMVVAAATSLFLQLYWFAMPEDAALAPERRAYLTQQQFAYVMLNTMVITTLAWLLVTFLTRPEPREKLIAFYERVRPAGPGWAAVRGQADDELAKPTESLAEQFVNWVLGCVLVYCSLFGIGYVIFKEWAWGFGLLAVALACAMALSRNLSRAATLALLATCIGVSPASAAPADSTENVFVGYVYRVPKDIRFGMYTHLCHAFVTADGEGNLTPNKQVPDRPFVEAAHAADVQVLLSLGGWGWDDEFSAIVADPAAEARYVDAVMRLVDEFDYDGLDLDWEYPDTADETSGFNRLAHTLRARLDEISRRKNRPLLLTMAASASPDALRWLDARVLLDTMDWINVMTYDYVGAWSKFAGHHSPLYASSKAPAENVMSTELTMKYLVDDKKLPPSRLAIGLPLYGKAFPVSKPYDPTEAAAADGAGSFNYVRLHDLHASAGWTRLWDDETKTPWLVAPDASRVVGYDDPQSAGLKTTWAMKQGFRGVFFWQIAGDRLPDGTNPVQESAHQAWSPHPQSSR